MKTLLRICYITVIVVTVLGLILDTTSGQYKDAMKGVTLILWILMTWGWFESSERKQKVIDKQDELISAQRQSISDMEQMKVLQDVLIDAQEQAILALKSKGNENKN